MKTLDQIRVGIMSTRYFTVPEVKQLAYGVLSSFPRERGIHDWFYQAACTLKESPFKYSPEYIQKLMEVAFEEFAREGRVLEKHEIPDAIKAAFSVQVELDEHTFSAPQKKVLADQKLINNVLKLDVTPETLVAGSIIYDAANWRAQDLLLRRYSGDTKLTVAWDKRRDCRMICLNSERFLKATQRIPSWLIPNPVKGEYGLTLNGRKSARAKSNLDSIIYVITEWDIPYTLEQQAKFIYYMSEELTNRDLVMIVYSGGESYHAWWKYSPGIIELAKKLDACGGTLNSAVELVRMPNAINPKTKLKQIVLYSV